jgi:hypothetical protein
MALKYLMDENVDPLYTNQLRRQKPELVVWAVGEPDVSSSAFYNFQKTFTIRFKQTLKRKNLLLAMFEATLFKKNPKSQWLGDYPQEAAKKRANSR